MDDLSAIVEYAERPRVGEWSLRSALVRYAQPEPTRAGAVLELVRRTDGALKAHAKVLERSPHLLSVARASSENSSVPAVDGSEHVGEEERTAVGVLVAALALDHLGDVLATWAASRSDDRPDREVDDVARRVFVMLGDLHVARETRPPRRS